MTNLIFWNIKEKIKDEYTLTEKDVNVINKSCYKDEKSYLKKTAGNIINKDSKFIFN